MNFSWSIFIVVLFVLLTPGIILRLPPKGGKFIVALVHGVVFAVVLCLIYRYIMKPVESYTGGGLGLLGHKASMRLV